ncbi:MAG: endonuclease/exonuclease/phosphatase family protein [Pirellulales bacterium]|nr:endonuclease/exonuclease/phosphatase family protein [Pirellulales bacterium]
MLFRPPLFRVLFALAPIGLLLAGWTAASAAAEPATLTVMSYNLRYASPKPPNSWPERRPAAKAMLEKFAPDLIGTQEGLYAQLKDLEADLPGFDQIGLGREGGSRGEFMAIFYRTERFEPLEYDHFWLSDTPEVIGSATWGNSVRRMVTWVRFLDRGTSREFYFVNTHFDHMSQKSREKSAELLLERLKKLDDKLPVIVVGDFNAVAESNKAYDTLVADGYLTDTWKVAQEKGKPISTFHNYRGPREDGSRIDWILTRGPVTTLSSEVVTFELNGQYPSDHFPVIAKLRFDQ